MKSQSIIRTILDIFACMAIFGLSVIISTIGLTIKANQYKADIRNQVPITVYKKPLPVLSSAKGIVQKVHVRPGQEVRRGDILIEIDNPSLRARIAALESHPENLSAQTEAEVAKIDLNYLNVPSPVDGVISEISVTEGAPIQELAPLVTLYSNEDVTLVGSLFTDQYLMVKELTLAKAYNPRLNQTFLMIPSLVRPDIQLPVGSVDEKKVGLYFTLVHPEDAASLLQNEDMELEITSDIAQSTRPVDLVVNFWNKVLFKTE